MNKGKERGIYDEMQRRGLLLVHRLLWNWVNAFALEENISREKRVNDLNVLFDSNSPDSFLKILEMSE